VASIALIGALCQWPIEGGGFYISILNLHHFDLAYLGFMAPLVATTCYSFLVLTKIMGEDRGPFWLFPRNKSKRAQGMVALLLAVIFSFILIMNQFFVGVSHHAGIYDMTWSYQKGYPARSTVIRLTYAKYPEFYQQCWSRELVDYLKNVSTPTIPVTFYMISDFGKTRGFFINKIGEIKILTPFQQFLGISGPVCTGGGYEKHTDIESNYGFDSRSMFMKDFQLD